MMKYDSLCPEAGFCIVNPLIKMVPIVELTNRLFMF